MDDTLETGRHPVNTGHLVMGLVFLGLVAVWALIAGDVVPERDAKWLLPVPWVAGGAIGLAVAAWANMRSRRVGTAGPVHPDHPPYDGDTEPPTAVLHEDGTDPTEEIR